MRDSDKIQVRNPLETLRSAISKLEVFVEQDNLKIEDGELVADDQPLETMLDRVRDFIVSLFSEKARKERDKKLQQIKQKILDAKDEANRYLPLLQKLQQGDSSQQSLAHWALSAINKYNTAVSFADPEHESISSWIKNRLLLDEEIKGKPIDLPQSWFVRYDSHPAKSAQRTLQTLSEVLCLNVPKKEIVPSPKETKQVMEDAFRMKATRTIKTHLAQANFLMDVLKLLQQTPIQMDEEQNDQVTMHQRVELAPGSIITLTGAFKKQSAGSKLMSIPILVDDIHLSSEFIQTGFPYPSQSSGLTLADPFVEAAPLRPEQTPLFAALDSKRKKVAHKLLFDAATIIRARELASQHEKIFNEHADLFLGLHEKFNRLLAKEMCATNELNSVFEAFYHYAASTASPFKVVTQAQEQINQLFIVRPFKKLHEDWLEDRYRLLRTGTASERFYLAVQILTDAQQQAFAFLQEDNLINRYLRGIGALIQSSAQSIILQYMSEKIGFAPPMLTDFERKMQRWAFQQLTRFLSSLEEKSPSHVKKETLECHWRADLTLFDEDENSEQADRSIALINELEVYFNSRFYSKISGSQR